MIGLYWQIPLIIFFLLPEKQRGLAKAIRIHRSLLSPLFQRYALAVAKPFSGCFVHLEKSSYGPSKKTVISLTANFQ